jgi:predicted HTH transcriptional regulator
MKSHLLPWTAADIAELLTSRPREDRMIEYKRELSIDRGDDVKEFLADVSAFANTGGGTILFGIDEKNGEPIGSPGIPIEDADKLVRRVESLIGDNLDPVLRGIHLDVITMEDGKQLLALRVPQSPAAPHMIKKGSPKFYSRGAAGKMPMDTYDLRSAFLASSAVH